MQTGFLCSCPYQYEHMENTTFEKGAKLAHAYINQNQSHLPQLCQSLSFHYFCTCKRARFNMRCMHCNGLFCLCLITNTYFTKMCQKVLQNRENDILKDKGPLGRCAIDVSETHTWVGHAFMLFSILAAAYLFSQMNSHKKFCRVYKAKIRGFQLCACIWLIPLRFCIAFSEKTCLGHVRL